MEKKGKKFEEKMIELETIISELENGNSSLEESISKYITAMKLVKELDEQLKSVEEQVSKIVSENGELEDFNIEEAN